jgi:type IV pilus assembly protein PilN
MRRINLLPPEERRARGRPGLPGTTRAGILGVLLILGALMVLVMVGLYLFYAYRLGKEEDRIAALDQDVARQQARIGELEPFSDLQARLDAKKPIADGIYRTRFPWDEFMQGLAFVIPESTALDSFTGQATPINIQAPLGQPPDLQNLEPPGAITFTGLALPEYQNVSDFIVRMNNLRFLSNTQLTTAELDRETFSEEAITFEVAAQLVTRVGENGNEVRIDDGAPPEGGEESQAEPQASVGGDQYGLADEEQEQYQYGSQGGGR